MGLGLVQVYVMMMLFSKDGLGRTIAGLGTQQPAPSILLRAISEPQIKRSKEIPQVTYVHASSVSIETKPKLIQLDCHGSATIATGRKSVLPTGVGGAGWRR